MGSNMQPDETGQHSHGGNAKHQALSHNNRLVNHTWPAISSQVVGSITIHAPPKADYFLTNV